MPKPLPTRYNYLCSGCFLLADFEVTIIGRFWGDRRGEKVPLNQFGLCDAYLIESRSIGGLSGSPVFCRGTKRIPVANEKGQMTYMAGTGEFHLLGLMHGHWDLPMQFADSDKVEAVNMGIAIVIPAKKILETLMNPTLVETRNTRARE